MTGQQAVEKWNAQHFVGTAVRVTKDNGMQIETRTRSAAYLLGGTAVIMLAGISGYYALSRVKAIEAEEGQ